MTSQLTPAVELCVSSTDADCVSALTSLLEQSSATPSVGPPRQITTCRQVQFHTMAQTTRHARFALPSFWRVSVFSEQVFPEPIYPGQLFSDQPAQSTDGKRAMQVGTLGYLPSDFRDRGRACVSGPDSFGLSTIRMPPCDSTADFVEDVLGMELLAVMVVDIQFADNIELYFYGFRRPADTLERYSVLELGQTQSEFILDVTDTAPAPLLQFQLTFSDLVFFADRLCNAEVDVGPIDTHRDSASVKQAEPTNLGVFSVPLQGA